MRGQYHKGKRGVGGVCSSIGVLNRRPVKIGEDRMGR